MSDIWDWRSELAEAHTTQTEIGKKIFATSSNAQMSTLVKKMVVGEGKTASERDKEKWNEALEYIQFKKMQLNRRAK